MSDCVQIAGFTSAGQRVVGGLFSLHDTHGVPLSFSIMLAELDGAVPDIFGFVNDAMAAGWGDKTIISRVREAVTDNGWSWPDVESRLLAQLAQTRIEVKS